MPHVAAARLTLDYPYETPATDDDQCTIFYYTAAEQAGTAVAQAYAELVEHINADPFFAKLWDQARNPIVTMLVDAQFAHISGAHHVTGAVGFDYLDTLHVAPNGEITYLDDYPVI